MNHLLKTSAIIATALACLVLSSGTTSAGVPAPVEKIVYQCRGDVNDGGGTDICLIDPDGTGYEHLTSDSTEDSAPRISPNGRDIVWRRDITDMWIMDSDGSNQRELLPDVISAFSSPTWSPDGHSIAFICSDPEDPNTDYICMTDREGASFDLYWTMEPRPTRIEWSPVNPNLILVEKADGANEDIHILQMHNGALTNITNTPDDYEHGTWSPDGFQIAFVGSPLPTDGTSLVSLYMMNSDGANRELLFTSDWSASATSPAWSPTGDRIAYFCSHTDVGAAEICMVDPVTTQLEDLLEEGVTDQYYLGKSPDWGFVGGPVFGDFDCDGDADEDDLLVLLQMVGGVGEPAEPCISLDGNEVNGHTQRAADLNCDDEVDASDGLPILLAQVGAPRIEDNCPVVGAVARIFNV